MDENIRFLSEDDFQQELDKLTEIMKREKESGSSYVARLSYLTGWVSSTSAPIYTQEQLNKIFDLAN